MGDLNIKGKVELRVNLETTRAIQKHYFEVGGYGSAIPCGSSILDSYAPTSTIQGCKRIAGGDGMLSAADLFVHYIFKEGIVPKRLRKHVVPDPNLTCTNTSPYGGGRRIRCSDEKVFVGIRFLKYMLEYFGLVYSGRPELQCGGYMDDPRMRGEDCYWHSSAAFLAKDIESSNLDYRQFSISDRIYSGDIMRRLERFINDRINPPSQDYFPGGYHVPNFPGEGEN